MTTEQCDLNIEYRDTISLLDDMLDLVNDHESDIDTICDVVRCYTEELIYRYQNKILQQ